METPIVETTAGPVRGVEESGVTRFLGIPYAAPPVGALRWRRPTPPEVASGVIDGESYGPAAPQLGAGSSLVDRVFRPIRGPSDEDCLYLNVWAARATETSEGRPVFVWFHGGGFVVGAGSTFLYDGTELARETGGVVVTVNYRLGALGFLDLRAVDPSAEPTANLGLFDQIAAVEWVRRNAERFGGDPSRITLVGESAGAMSLGCLLAARPELASRFILQSGAADHVSGPQRAREIARAFLDELDLRATDFAALQQLTIEELLRAQRATTLRSMTWGGELPWQPTVGDELLPRPPLELIEDGTGPLPAVIVGTNRHEWRLFANAGVHLRAMSRAALEKRIVRRLGFGPDRARELFELYQARPDGVPRRPYSIWTAIRTDQFFRVPAIELADRLVERGAAVYLYRFDLRLPAFPRSFGACHAVEVPLLFATDQHPLLKPLYGQRAEVVTAGMLIRRYWRSFAERGLPATHDEWPPFADRRTTAQLSDVLRAVEDPGRATRQWWRAVRAERRATASAGSDLSG